MANSKSKVNLACDTCRQRKSRCDGLRPICSHCRQAGCSCTYRPTPTNLESDSSVLSRLAEVETRLRLLEKRCQSEGTRESEPECVGPPDLHTASASSMLHYWPRIRLSLVRPPPTSRTYLADCDRADPLLMDMDVPPTVPLSARQLHDAFTGPAVAQLPAPLASLVEHYPGLLHSFAHLTDDTTLVDTVALTVPQLLVLSVALRTTAPAAACCRLALQKLWVLRGGPEDDLVPLVLALASCLLHFWVRPFHALGLLQSIDMDIKHMAMRQPDHPLLPYYARLHFIMESDILTELEGFPSSASQQILQKVLPTDGPTDVFMASHVQLRSFLNRILHLLYSPTKAYAQPHELADLVCSLSVSLRHWYQAQPREHQFVRDITIFRMHAVTLPFRLREVAQRYFYCVFLLHRPVLYFFLHREMEYLVRPPDSRTVHMDREPWVLESCRDCIEAAALLIHFQSPSTAEADAKSDTPYPSWCGTQALFSAYLVLLQVRQVPGLAPVFRNMGDLDLLLDLVEQVLASGPVASLQIKKSLEILQEARQGFDAASPLQMG